jgi:hypothetical protein
MRHLKKKALKALMQIKVRHERNERLTGIIISRRKIKNHNFKPNYLLN